MSGENQRHTRVILDSINDGVFTVDRNFRITLLNRAAERITGMPRAEAIGKPCWEVLRGSICESNCALKETMRTGEPIVNKALYIVNSIGERVPISVSTALLVDEKGGTIGGVEIFRDLSLLEELQKKLESRYTFADIISQNPAMLELFNVIPAVADSNSTVLIEGESGTGKELLARAIHNLGPRKDRPLVVVNCGALPDSLLESELFGYKAGAFTDAKSDRKGRFAHAEGGTIFLDEIGDISPAMQVKLLRVLQDRTYEPLGSSETVTADVRVITATNRDLQELLDAGQFRLDLYYRINVLTLRLPPLRDRKSDMPLLVDHFITHFNRLTGREIAGMAPEAMAVLMNYDFPGNIRELENIVERAFVLISGDMILPQHLPENLKPQMPNKAGDSIMDALARNGGNRQATAKELGIHKTTLWRKMRRLGLLPA